MENLITDMIEAGSKPDTAGQRTWPNWKVKDAITTLRAEIASRDAALVKARAAALEEAEAAVHNSLIVLAMPGADTRPKNAYSKAILAIRALATQGDGA